MLNIKLVDGFFAVTSMIGIYIQILRCKKMHARVPLGTTVWSLFSPRNEFYFFFVFIFFFFLLTIPRPMQRGRVSVGFEEEIRNDDVSTRVFQTVTSIAGQGAVEPVRRPQRSWREGERRQKKKKRKN